MKRLNLLSIALLMCTAAAFAQSTPSATPPSASTIIDRQVTGVEREIVSLVDAMPADKFDFAPTNGEFKGVRTFGQMVKHVAITNVEIASALLGDKPLGFTEEEQTNGPANINGKEQILQYLKDSFAKLHKGVAGITDQNLTAPMPNPFGGKNPVNRLGMSILAVGHTFDHYGQLVEYLRDNGKVPPASQPAPPPAKK